MYIVPKINVIDNSKEKESFFCSICNFCLITKADYDYHKKTGACEECYYTFVEAIKNDWDKDNKQIDKKKLKQYIYVRNKSNSEQIKLS